MAFTQEEENAIRGMLAVFKAGAASLSDDAALMCPDVYPEWSGEGLFYAAGERLRYDGALYTVLQDHKSQPGWTPKSAPSLFAAALSDGEEGVKEWVQPDSTNGYAKGDRVTHNGRVWESAYDGPNVWEPGATGVGEDIWKDVTEGVEEVA